MTDEISPILNLETLNDIREMDAPGKNDFLLKILGAYLTDTVKRFHSLAEAYKAKDISSIISLAHTIKGSSLNVGADNLATLMQRIEKEGKSGSLCSLESIAEAEILFRKTRDALLAYAD
jgi:two-component system, sensor histidine kinase and response regulator